MRRILILSCAAALAGCQSQNPYAFFGPTRVPPPGATSPAPYYPDASAGPAIASTGTSAGQGPAAPIAPASARPTLSADAMPSASSSSSSFATDASDLEPIKIVENPVPAQRTASVPPPRSNSLPPQPASIPPTFGQPPSAPPAAPASGKSTSTAPKSGVVPAAFFESAPQGQWKAR